MSWLKNVASKAEGFLNDLDAAAGETIQNSNFKDALTQGMTPSRSFNRLEDLNRGNGSHTPTHDSETSNTLSPMTTRKMNSSSENLINSNLSAVSHHHHRRESSLSMLSSISRDGQHHIDKDYEYDRDKDLKSQTSINMEITSRNLQSSPFVTNSMHTSRKASNDSGDDLTSSYTNLTAGLQSTAPVSISITDTANTENNPPVLPSNSITNTIPQSASNYSLASLSGPTNYEVQVLKSEIGGLNKELTRYLDKCQMYEKDNRNLKNKITTQDQLIHKYNTDLENYKSINFEQMEEIDYMKNDLLSKTNMIHDLSNKLNEKTDQANHLMYNSTHQSDVHNSTFDTLQEKMDQMEKSLQNEINLKKKLEIQLDEDRNKYMNDRSDFTKQIHDKDMSLESERRKANNLTIQNKQIKAQLETVQQELSDYKEKAQRILQSKERLIDNLKSSDIGKGNVKDNASLNVENEALTMKLDEMAHEKDDYGVGGRKWPVKIGLERHMIKKV